MQFLKSLSHSSLKCLSLVRVHHAKLQGGGGGGQRFAGESNSPISIVPPLKLTSVLILKGPYSIEKCATCFDTCLRFWS